MWQSYKRDLLSISSTLYVRIFRTNVVSAAFLHTVTRKKAAEMTIIRKICAFNIDEIDTLKTTSRKVEIISFILVVRLWNVT